MKNIYIEKIKGIMQKFLTAEQERDKKIKQNNGYFSSNVANDMNRKIEAESEADYSNAVSKINDIFKVLRNKIGVMTSLDGNAITADSKLLEGVFSLKRGDVIKLIQKYQSNYTMLTMIEGYINSNFADDFELKALIPSPLQLLEKYRDVFQSAINQLGAIRNNSNTNIDDFGTNSALIEYLGSGRDIDEIAFNQNEHTFDNIFLIREYSNTFEELR